MPSHDLESVALTLVAEGKGILAADETIPTLTRRFDSLEYVGETSLNLAGEPVNFFEVQRASSGQLQQAQA